MTQNLSNSFQTVMHPIVFKAVFMRAVLGFRTTWPWATSAPLVFSALLLVSLGSARAAPSTPVFSPSAGSLSQQIDRARELNREPSLPIEEPEKPTNKRAASGPSFSVKEFQFSGNQLFTSAQLSAQLRSYLNRSLQLSDLQEASASVANFYRRSGWVVQAQLPPQDIVNGVVKIQILEAAFGRVSVEGANPKRVKPEQIIQTIYAAQAPGTPLNINAIDRGLALVGDLAGVTVQGNLAPGQTQGETDLIVSVLDKPFITGEAGSDNSGSRSTGGNRITSNLSLNSPMGLGDLFAINLLASSGSDYVRFSETLPLGYSGLRVGVNASTLAYHLVTQDFAALNAKGVASSVGLELSYPLQKTRSSLLSAVLSADQKHYVNNAQGTLASDYANTPVSLSLNGLGSDSWAGGGSTLASLNLTAGSINLSRSPVQFQASDASTTQTAGPYAKIRYMLSREQNWFSGFSLYAALSGQTANKNVDSSEKFYLGGVNGVRAYPSNEAGGTKAEMVNLEVRSRWKDRYVLNAFYDYGRVVINSSNQFVGASALNQYALKGSGISIGYQAPSGASLKATFSSRIGSNPNPTASGNDQDGSRVKSRVWLNANVPF